MFDWFTTIPGILIISGVVLLLIAIILFIAGNKKGEKETKVVDKEEAHEVEPVVTEEVAPEMTEDTPITEEVVEEITIEVPVIDEVEEQPTEEPVISTEENIITPEEQTEEKVEELQ